MTSAIQVLAWFGVAVMLAAPLPEGWQSIGDGNWHLLGTSVPMMHQGNATGTADAIAPPLAESGNVWRCRVEAAPGAQQAGFWFAAAPDLSRGYLLTLDGEPSRTSAGVTLRNAAGDVLWQDAGAAWTYYTPYVLEGVAEAGRMRVQMFAWDSTTLLAQSDWIDAPAPETDTAFALHTRDSMARFSHWTRATEALSPIVADSPSKLRLDTRPGSEWSVVGDRGDWRWTSADHAVLRQGAGVERSTAVNSALGGTEGTWRCAVTVDEGAGGAGLVFLSTGDLARGYMAWLGGDHGNGGLMLYQLPLKSMWSSPQGKWHYDEPLTIEATVADGKVSCRLLKAADGSVVAESPAFDLAQEEFGRNIGLQVWKGTASFAGFSESTQAEAETTQPVQASSLGEGWRLAGGEWQWANEAKTALAQISGAADAAALNTATKAAKGVYSARVTPGDGATAVGLLFQASPDMKKGFELRIEKGVQLRTLDGRVLWRDDGFEWAPGTVYVLEGKVITDRVLVRVMDDAANVLARSHDCYVSDSNNAREGGIGFRTAGPAAFSAWSVRAAAE